MPLQTFNFPVVGPYGGIIKPDYSGYSDFTKNLMESYERPIKQQQEMSQRDEAIRLAQLNRALQEKYGEPQADAELALRQAQADGVRQSQSLNQAKIQKIMADMQRNEALKDMFESAIVNMTSPSVGRSGDEIGGISSSGFADARSSGRERQARLAQMLAASGDIKEAAKTWFSETPEEKSHREIMADFLKREKRSSLPTSSFLTQNQKVVQGVENVVPMIDELREMNVPNQTIYPGVHSPERQAAYKAHVSAITDTLLGALGLTSTKENAEITKKLIEKQRGEGDSAYRKRLNNVIKDLERRKKSSESILNPAKSLPRYTEEDLRFTADKHGITIEELKKRLGDE